MKARMFFLSLCANRCSPRGKMCTGEATLTTEPPVPVFLFNTGTGVYTVWKLGSEPAMLRLETPEGTIEAVQIPFGKLVYRPGEKEVLEVFTSDWAEVRMTSAPEDAIYEWNARIIQPQTGKQTGELLLKP